MTGVGRAHGGRKAVWRRAGAEQRKALQALKRAAAFCVSAFCVSGNRRRKPPFSGKSGTLGWLLARQLVVGSS